MSRISDALFSTDEDSLAIARLFSKLDETFDNFRKSCQNANNCTTRISRKLAETDKKRSTTDDEFARKASAVGWTSKADDMVNSPKHYKGHKFEVIDIIEDFDLDFCLANAVKYILRSAKKWNTKEDLQKAIWYLNREISRLEKVERDTLIHSTIHTDDTSTAGSNDTSTTGSKEKSAYTCTM